MQNNRKFKVGDWVTWKNYYLPEVAPTIGYIKDIYKDYLTIVYSYDGGEYFVKIDNSIPNSLKLWLPSTLDIVAYNNKLDSEWRPAQFIGYNEEKDEFVVLPCEYGEWKIINGTTPFYIKADFIKPISMLEEPKKKFYVPEGLFYYSECFKTINGLKISNRIFTSNDFRNWCLSSFSIYASTNKSKDLEFVKIDPTVEVLNDGSFYVLILKSKNPDSYTKEGYEVNPEIFCLKCGNKWFNYSNDEVRFNLEKGVISCLDKLDIYEVRVV